MLFAQLLDTGRSELNRALSDTLIWYIPLLIIGFYLVFRSYLKRKSVFNINLEITVQAVFWVIGGLVLGGLAGIFLISFGMCYGKECSTTAEVLPGLLAALLSLVFTIPKVRRLYKESNSKQSNTIKFEHKTYPFLGLIIIVWSTAVYVPRIIKAYNSYQVEKSSK